MGLLGAHSLNVRQATGASLPHVHVARASETGVEEYHQRVDDRIASPLGLFTSATRPKAHARQDCGHARCHGGEQLGGDHGHIMASGSSPRSTLESLLAALASRLGASIRTGAENYLIPQLDDIKLLELRAQHLDRMYAVIALGRRGRPLRASSIQRVHAVLRSAPNTAIKRPLIAFSPADHIEPPSGIRSDPGRGQSRRPGSSSSGSPTNGSRSAAYPMPASPSPPASISRWYPSGWGHSQISPSPPTSHPRLPRRREGCRGPVRRHPARRSGCTSCSIPAAGPRF